jgi:hypothetical protein
MLIILLLCVYCLPVDVFSATFCANTALQLMNLNVARETILKESMAQLKGNIAASPPHLMNIPFRVHFEVPSPSEEEVEGEGEKEAEVKEKNAIDIDCQVVVHDIDVKPYVTVYIIDEDTGIEEIVRLYNNNDDGAGFDSFY